MSTAVYPGSPLPSWTYPFEESFQTLVSDYQGQNRQGQIQQRFAMKGFSLTYKNTNLLTEWPTVHNFFRKRRGGGDPFWYFDFWSRPWTDEYVGYGGPLPLDGAIADDGGSQTDETDIANAGTANGMTLLPAVPVVNDAYYFINKIMFDKVTVVIGIPGIGTWTIVWEYLRSDGTWVALSGVTDGTTGFNAAAGSHDVTFSIPSDWIDGLVKQRFGYAVRARVSAYTSVTTQPKGSGATVNTETYDLPSMATTNDASLIVYVNGVATAKTFISGGGAGGADRIAFAGYQATGALITADFKGQLRIYAVIPDKFSDEGIAPNISNVATVRISEWVKR